MRIKSIYGLSCIVVLLFCLLVISCANETTVEEDVLNVENLWVNAFNDMDFDSMSSLYWHSIETQVYSPNVFSKKWSANASSPFPTVLSKGWESIEAVLKEYCEQPKGVYTWSLRDTQLTMLTDDVAQVIGFHDLSKKPADGSEPTPVSLRFTHLVQKIDGKWVIVHSHETRQQAARQPIGPDGEAAGAQSGEPGIDAPAGPGGPDMTPGPAVSGSAGAGGPVSGEAEPAGAVSAGPGSDRAN